MPQPAGQSAGQHWQAPAAELLFHGPLHVLHARRGALAAWSQVVLGWDAASNPGVGGAAAALGGGGLALVGIEGQVAQHAQHVVLLQLAGGECGADGCQRRDEILLARGRRGGVGWGGGGHDWELHGR